MHGDLTDLLFVSFCVFQLLEIVCLVELENENPALAVRFAVNQPRVGFERFVYLHDCSFYRRVDIARRFYGFDDCNCFFCVCLSILFWQLDVNHVSQFRLGVIGNADTDVVAFAFNLFV